MGPYLSTRFRKIFMISSIVNSLTAADPGSNPAAVLMLRKALDLQTQGAAQLIQSIPAIATGGSNPPHLGQNIDIKV
jgi:hypothetical protein